jgi:hypothetical protein
MKQSRLTPARSVNVCTLPTPCRFRHGMVEGKRLLVKNKPRARQRDCSIGILQAPLFLREFFSKLVPCGVTVIRSPPLMVENPLVRPGSQGSGRCCFSACQRSSKAESNFVAFLSMLDVFVAYFDAKCNDPSV